MLHEIEAELQRVAAHHVSVALDDQFEPEAGTLVRVQIGSAYWHLLPEHFLDLLKRLSANTGDEAVRRAIEKRGPFVWHGPSPPDSRDTSA